MVDFNNETTIGTPAVDIVRVLVLQRRNDFIEALEQYNKQNHAGVDPPTYIVRARLISLYYEIKPMLIRKYKDKEYIMILEKSLNEGAMNEILTVWELINNFLDTIQLTRIDTRQYIDTTSVLSETRSKIN